MKRFFLGIFIVVISLFLFVLFRVEYFQTISTFPSTGKEKINIDNVDKIYLKNSKGEKLSGVYINNNSDKIIVYFHGNGGSLNLFENDIKFLSKITNFDIIAYDFPGYGESEGFPSEKNLYEATELFHNYIVKSLKKDESNIISIGYSVGTSLATDYAYKHKLSKLVLISPFTSRYEMSEYYIGLNIPKIGGLPNSLVSSEKIKKINIPTLIIHGNKDIIIPFEMGKKLYNNSISDNKYFVEVDNFGHNGFFRLYKKEAEILLKSFIFDKKIQKNELKIDKKANFITNFIDLISDDSYQKFLSSNVSFINKKYIPSDLVDIKSNNIVNLKNGLKIRKEANKSLNKMSKDYNLSTNKKIKIASSYRSYIYQKGIIDRGCSPEFCSKPGYSEHQSGLAIDFFEATTENIFLSKSENKLWFDWMNKNAHKYGWHNTYQKGIEVDTYHTEPWHWRYVGEEFATYLLENNLTIAEYYNLKIREGK